MKSIADKIVKAIDEDLDCRMGLMQVWDQIRGSVKNEILLSWKKIIQDTIMEAGLTVEIEVGGDHGDGNVALVTKPKGVKVIITDFDNAELPEDAGEDAETIPDVKEYEADVEV